MTDWVTVEPLTDEPADRAFWHEPMEPQIGDRVRARPNPECPGWDDHNSPKFVGRICTVTYVNRQRSDRHAYLLVPDDCPMTSPCPGHWTSACELEPLS